MGAHAVSIPETNDAPHPWDYELEQINADEYAKAWVKGDHTASPLYGGWWYDCPPTTTRKPWTGCTKELRGFISGG